MKKNLIILILFTFVIICCSPKQKTNFKESFFIINVLGANVYKEPSLDSEVIEKIKPNVKIIAEKILEPKQRVSIDNEFYLEGNFVKINHKGTSGYIFSSDLTKIKPELKKIYDNIFIPNIQGKEKSKRIKKRTETFDNKEYEIEDEITEYENLTYTYTAFDGCFDHVYLYRNMSLSEVYHQLTIHYIGINETLEGNFIEIPKFKEKKGNKYFFVSEGATQDLKIIDNNDGTYTISSYDCT